MSYLSKEDYDRRRENAAKRMSRNKEIALENGTLTEEQCDALEELCRARHEIHSADIEELLVGEDNNRFDPMFDHLGDTIVDEVKSLFNDCKIIQYAPEDIPSDIDWFELMDDEEKEEYEKKAVQENSNLDGYEYQEQLETISSLVEKWNESVEEFLHNIDERCGTSYEPTGAQRIF